MSRRLEIKGRELVSRGGVGAIVEIGRQSFVTTDLLHWGAGRYQGEVIDLPRLARRLGVRELKSANGVGTLGKLGPAFVRFPTWLFCERCGAFDRYPPGSTGSSQPVCRDCRGGMIGVRWVGGCPNGHLFDIPWRHWAHLNRLKRKVVDPNCRGRRGLWLGSQSGRGAAESALIVACRECKAGSSLAGLSGSGTLNAVGMPTCPGSQPWVDGAHAEECDEAPRVMMRASTRLYFPSSVSMLDIPPDSDRKPVTDLDARIRQSVNAFQIAIWKGKRQEGTDIDDLEAYATELGCAKEDIEAFIDQELGIEPAGRPMEGALELGEDADEEQKSLIDEWSAMMSPRPDQPAWCRFLTEQIDVSELGPDLSRLLDRLVLVHRLREVRAFTGYKRISDQGRRMPPTALLPSGKLKLSWLPVHEVMGEGVFINLSSRALQRWDDRQVDPETLSARETVDTRLAGSGFSKGSRRVAMTGVHFVLLHTLAHLLLREMAYSAGYSAASIRKRIFHGPTETGWANGILLYTAHGDSEGTLGGLVRLGEPARLRQAMERLVERSAWCGQDPVCRESHGQGLHALNLAACHGCALVSETSCAHANVLLDRNRIISRRPGAPGLLTGAVGE